MLNRAGGVIWRRSSDDTIKVLLVHRRRDDGWSLPKGKLRPGETARAAARREVREETGLRCDIGILVADVSYIDGKQRPTRARFWAMQPRSGAFRENDEVDAVRWVRLDDAAALVTREHDQVVLGRFVELVVRAA